MSLAVLASQGLAGLQALPVRVEVHVGRGLPSFHVVGLPDAGVRESRERVRSAIVSSGFEFPAGRVTVNLAPADLPKESGRFDLPIALGVLLASGQVRVSDQSTGTHIADYVFAGELSLTGAVMPITAPLLLALGVASDKPGRTLVLPAQGAGLAAHVGHVSVLQAHTLEQVVRHFNGLERLPSASPRDLSPTQAILPCMSDVRGQDIARHVLEVAASGGHSLLMVGPPGTGKSMLAHRLPGISSPLSVAHALETMAIQGVCAPLSNTFSNAVPFRAPHHSISVPALVGGGFYPRPGEISRAHRGVLFLDELLEFSRGALEALREPLEHGSVAIARAHGSVTFPAMFQLVAAMNPCPCGWRGHSTKSCSCTPDRVMRYRSKISGPFLDRLDLHIALHAGGDDWLAQPAGEASASIRQRVDQCRQQQYGRQGCLNALLSAAQVQVYCELDAAGTRLLRQSSQHWAWSSRAVHRLLRVARTLADMVGASDIQVQQLAEAIQYRQAWPD